MHFNIEGRRDGLGKPSCQYHLTLQSLLTIVFANTIGQEGFPCSLGSGCFKSSRLSLQAVLFECCLCSRSMRVSIVHPTYTTLILESISLQFKPSSTWQFETQVETYQIIRNPNWSKRPSNSIDLQSKLFESLTLVIHSSPYSTRSLQTNVWKLRRKKTQAMSTKPHNCNFNTKWCYACKATINGLKLHSTIPLSYHSHLKLQQLSLLYIGAQNNEIVAKSLATCIWRLGYTKRMYSSFSKSKVSISIGSRTYKHRAEWATWITMKVNIWQAWNPQNPKLKQTWCDPPILWRTALMKPWLHRSFI